MFFFHGHSDRLEAGLWLDQNNWLSMRARQLGCALVALVWRRGQAIMILVPYPQLSDANNYGVGTLTTLTNCNSNNGNLLVELHPLCCHL
jgi:hypothetical protein